MNIFKKLFNRKVSQQPTLDVIVPEKEINLANISQFDDVWIQVGDKIFEGWVVEKIKNQIYISYTNENHKLDDAVFIIERPLNRAFIEQNNKKLFLNKEDINGKNV